MIDIIVGLEEIDSVADAILEQSHSQGIILLFGNLASGKTTLVQACARKAGITEIPTSPTYLLMQQYGEDFYHYDLYNKEKEQFLEHGLLEMVANGGLHFIEWPDAGLMKLFLEWELHPLVVEIEPVEGKRRYRIYHA